MVWALVVCTAVGCLMSCGLDMPKETKTSYETITVKKQDLTVPVKFSAKLKGQADVTITPQVSGQLLRFVLGAAFVSYILGRTVHWGGMLGIFVVQAVVFSIVFSPSLRKRSERMSQTFNDNLSQHKKKEE